MLLEYALGDKRSYLWAVTQTSIAGYELPGRAEIETAARRFYELIKGNAKREEIEESAARLSQMALAPAIEQFGKRRLAIVADGALQYVPFAALPKPQTERQRERGTERQGDKDTTRREKSPLPTPLIVEHEIVTLPSASALAVLRRETAGRLMASLWQVDDAATSELMGRFYRGMLGDKRLSPAAALRAAQIEMWKRKGWQSPYYWAAFTLQGEWK